MDEATEKLLNQQAEQIKQLKKAVQALEKKLRVVAKEAARAKDTGHRNSMAIDTLNRRTGGK